MGADGGGPRREFFFRMIEEMGKQNMLFEGPDECRIPKHNLLALQGKKFYLIGKIIALSVLHGGPAPKFFAQHILEYLFYGHVTGNKPNIARIYNKDVKEQALKVRIIVQYVYMHVSVQMTDCLCMHEQCCNYTLDC